MKIQTTEAQAWWIALADEIRPVRGIDGSKLAAGLQSIFNFPSPPSEIKGGGIEFLNGRLVDDNQNIPIAKIVVFNDGINIQVPTNSDDAEVILQEALTFAFDLGVRRPTSGALHFYQSTITADFECSLDSIFPSALLRKISEATPIAGELHFLNIATNFDAETVADGRWRGINPTLFRIDRRVSIPYSLNRYFCVANMKTSDHIEILNEFEEFASIARR